jgi:hypothetical protein
MARREKSTYSATDIDEAITALRVRMEKLMAVKTGMKANKLEALQLDYGASLSKGLDGIRDFCDGALSVLRKLSDRGNRPWDKWDD